MLSGLPVGPRVLVPLAGAFVVVVIAGVYLASPLVIRTRAVEQSPFAPRESMAEPAASAEVGDRIGLDSMAIEAAPGLSVESGSVTQGPGTRRGRFSDRDQIHRGSGEVILGQTPQGATVLRFETFSVTNGPDLHVFLSRTAQPSSHDDVHNGLYVGKLKASEGAFNYELPAGSDLAGVQSVVVYCVPFRVIFTSASLVG